MAEWSKAHAWKVCKRHKRFMGSNPILSAKKNHTSVLDFVLLQVVVMTEANNFKNKIQKIDIINYICDIVNLLTPNPKLNK